MLENTKTKFMKNKLSVIFDVLCSNSLKKVNAIIKNKSNRIINLNIFRNSVNFQVMKRKKLTKPNKILVFRSYLNICCSLLLEINP